MDQKTYIHTVLSALHHVTKRERDAIRWELAGHMEDHMEGLLELGYSPELAEERTLSAMGDPKEVGRELNRQYPPGVAGDRPDGHGRGAGVCSGGGGAGVECLRDTVLPNFQARWFPTAIWDLTETSISDPMTGRKGALAGGGEEKPNMRQTEDGVTAWLYQVGLEDPTAEKTTAWFAVSLSSVNPFKKPNQYEWRGMRMEEIRRPPARPFMCITGSYSAGR